MTRSLKDLMLFATFAVLITSISGCAGGGGLGRFAFWRGPDEYITDETEIAYAEEGTEQDAAVTESTEEVAVAQSYPGTDTPRDVIAGSSVQTASATVAAPPTAATPSGAFQSENVQVAGANVPVNNLPVNSGPVAPWNVDQSSYTLARRDVTTPTTNVNTHTPVNTQQVAPTSNNQFQAQSGTAAPWEGSNETASAYAQPVRGASYER